ncbi:complement C1q tumor necrosis factor-related protein 3-like [Heptranchias perlo]|uniref:complement C1q tumor necrosis factor-related protein 3-like n=1 Tax=Heptranchias perlo TaxID=212740 RepID=UPI00355A083A
MTSGGNVHEFIMETQEKMGHLNSDKLKANVIFDVQRSAENHVQTPVDAILYDVVRVNRGEAYSPKTGKFTCPKCGLYFFSYSSLPGRGQKTDVSLMKDRKEVSLIHSVLPKDSSQLSMRNVILELHKGDMVWVRLASGNLWSEGGSLSFQGFLLAH